MLKEGENKGDDLLAVCLLGVRVNVRSSLSFSYVATGDEVAVLRVEKREI